MFVFARHLFSLTILIGLSSETLCSQLLLNKNVKPPATVGSAKNTVEPKEVQVHNEFEFKIDEYLHTREQLFKLLQDGYKQSKIPKHRVIRSADVKTSSHLYPGLPSPYYNYSQTSASNIPYNTKTPVYNQQWQQLPNNNTYSSGPYYNNNPSYPNTNYPSYPNTNYPSYPGNTQTYPSYNPNTPNNYPNQQTNYYGQVNNTRPNYPHQPSGNSAYNTQRTPQYPSYNNVSPFPPYNYNQRPHHPGYSSSTLRPGYPSYNPSGQYNQYNNTYPSQQQSFYPTPSTPYNSNQRPENQHYGQRNDVNPNYPGHNPNFSGYNSSSSSYPSNPSYNPNQSYTNQPYGQQSYPGQIPAPNQFPSNYPSHPNQRPSNDFNQYPGYSQGPYDSNTPNRHSSPSDNQSYYPVKNNQGQSPNYDPRKNPPQNFSY